MTNGQQLLLPDLNPFILGPLDLDILNKKPKLELKIYLKSRNKFARNPKQRDMLYQCKLISELEQDSKINLKWLSFYKAGALLDDPVSIFKMAQIYHGMRDIGTAVYWYEKGVKLGHVECMDMIGTIFFTGAQGYRNDLIAINYYQQAIIMNYLPSFINIGLLYIRSKDYAKALCYFSKAFKLGSTIASFHIAMMYVKGLFVKQSYECAIHHLMRCYHTFDKDANAEYQIPYLIGHLNMELRNYELAIKYFNICEGSDHDVAVFELGNLYLHGNGIKKSKLHALKLFERSASLGYVPAIKAAAMLAMLLPIYTSAFKWNEIIAIQLGRCFICLSFTIEALELAVIMCNPTHGW